MKSKLSSKKPSRPRVHLRRVVGDSMTPTFRAGQLVAVIPGGKLQIGDVIMFEHEGLEKIKRVARMDGARLYVLGDNPQASTDSRQFGWVGAESVRGKVLWPKSRKSTLAQ